MINSWQGRLAAGPQNDLIPGFLRGHPLGGPRSGLATTLSRFRAGLSDTISETVQPRFNTLNPLLQEPLINLEWPSRLPAAWPTCAASV